MMQRHARISRGNPPVPAYHFESS